MSTKSCKKETPISRIFVDGVSGCYIWTARNGEVKGHIFWNLFFSKVPEIGGQNMNGFSFPAAAVGAMSLLKTNFSNRSGFHDSSH
jgi:hypothetical protein